MSKQANKQLLQAVLEPRQPGAIRQIADAIAAGADPNGIVAETSTSTGYVRGGSTLLTHAVHEEASRVVEQLLEGGADPNLADENGWTPWMASTLADDKQERIQSLLRESGAGTEGEHIGSLASAIWAGDVDKARSLLKTDRDLQILTTFRVDLLRHQVLQGNAAMLEFMLERGVPAESSHLTSAIRAPYPEGVKILLRHGVAPEQPGQEETPLMMAAGMGELQIVQLLVEAGADVNHAAHGNPEWTAAFSARQAGHQAVADWLTKQTNPALLAEQQKIADARDPRYRLLYEMATASEDLSTDDIIAVLQQWHEKYGIEVRDARGDSATLEFSSLPDDMDGFFEEVERFCPDITEDKSAFQKAFGKSKSLQLWWD
jgi:ankyrin repeat protein